MNQNEDSLVELYKMEQQPVQQRQVAKIVSANQLLSGTYEEKTGWEPNVVKTAAGDVSRVNIIGVIVEISGSQQNNVYEQFRCILDDGTGTVEIRAFDTLSVVSELAIGSPVLIIGRPKQYNNIIFIVPEIVRLLPSTEWVDWRKKQIMEISPREMKPVQKIPIIEKTVEPSPQAVSGIDDIEEEDTEPQGDFDSPILEYIDNEDKGDGVLIEVVIKAFDGKQENVKQKITNLLLNGEIFEIRPGRIKVLK